VIPGSCLVASLLVLHYSLSLRITGSAVAACLAIPLCMWSGGVGILALSDAGFTWANFMK
jgi:hypothetical protein